ncbi:neuropilin-1a-like protein [Lates japonicus]|uniref:Neuropilin-1a-like protein n=1 Tax=Lates japonicus TaxID=270547 RepID=A0AAD3NKG9_LATJO|nr:neuropilin-1a-like protein [Lates japonicus]
MLLLFQGILPTPPSAPGKTQFRCREIEVSSRTERDPSWYDYVEVYNAGRSSPCWESFAGRSLPPIISSAASPSSLSPSRDPRGGFSVRHEVFKTGPECSRNFTAPRGVIKTPGFPDKYPNNLDCTFMIFAPKMSEIVVEFDSFDMEPDTTPPPGALCRYDWLEIWDGFPAVGPHIGRYCGQTSPGRVISYTGILSMTITTDNAIAREGFSANYTIRERSLPPGHEDEDFACMEPLGMESGEISSDQISASSQYNSNWSPERSRLNYQENGWTPSDDTVREWIQSFCCWPLTGSSVFHQDTLTGDTEGARGQKLLGLGSVCGGRTDSCMCVLLFNSSFVGSPS